ncbi:hypothetical protein RRU94_18375 [Domibacillus sp. DTU_2020_1001157_1_SI_ALB_TIR_016]|uniref:hypothetical protein n=1 Tax=Domibacillus sp. DTU_2020_1001157_1_SI_ALB_TIR_016 TaxID=3077789 RepID=UPI0028E6F119|nr:hypothetical protein [Domibacillus sp. DTU_2020_1001157_1_SI_ALB_TIR_016]WNS79495.1 hypothetical protein RRU94_18375 [Domibacillus sp. DTU_2020_1001157_1_SI_ALB_TIR_016]
MKMSVTRGLAELKLLDKRIKTVMNSAAFVDFAIGEKAVNGYTSNKEYEDKVQSAYQSVKDLIKRRNDIKSAIVLSNAMTRVKIADKEYTVAEAIERKTSIQYEVQLMQKMKNEYTKAINNIQRINEEVKEELNRKLDALYGREAKTKVDENNELVKSYRNDNEAKMIDPLKIRHTYEKLEQEIDEFLSEVDFVLSTSNTLTEIEVPE